MTRRLKCVLLTLCAWGCARTASHREFRRTGLLPPLTRMLRTRALRVGVAGSADIGKEVWEIAGCVRCKLQL